MLLYFVAALYVTLNLTTFVHCTLDPIVTNGSHLFYSSNGSQFFVRGVVYRLKGNSARPLDPLNDPLSDGPTCARDIPHLTNLGINVIRTYSLNPNLDHSACMEQLQAAGIYVLFDLSGNDRVFDLTGSSPRRNGDPNVPVWTNELYLRYTRLIDAFQSYPNVLGAFIGTRVVQTPHSTDALVFLKAATRDIKAYIKEKKYRNIPIGYSGRFGTIVDTFLADYLVCGEESETIDFLGFEDFHWCGNSTFAASGYDDALRTFKGYARPVMISEYGCNSVRPRFQEVEAIYSSKNMTDVFSGGVAYEFYKNTDFGLVTEEGGELVENSDFSALSAQLALATPSSTAVGEWGPTPVIKESCSTTGDGFSVATVLPPFPYAKLCTCMMDTLGCIANSSNTEIGRMASLRSLCDNNTSRCNGVRGNGVSGQYGAYSVCNVTERLSWVINQEYISQNNSDLSCSNADGVIQKSSLSIAPDPNSDCQILLQQAGADGTGTITSTPGALTMLPTPSGQQPPPSEKLTIGAQAGIVLGVTIFVMLLAGAVLFLRDRRQQNKELPSSAEGFYNMEPPKDPGSWFNAWDSRENLHSTGRAEITGNNGQIPDLPDASKRFGMLAEYDPSELPIVK